MLTRVSFSGSERIKVAQLDTGYTLHPETADFRISLGRNFIRRENGKPPLDTLESTRPIPFLWGGHGTSCASVMIGKSVGVVQNNDPSPDKKLFFDDRVEGVFRNIDLIPYRISKNIISLNNNMARALEHIVDAGDIPIISMSHASLIARRSHKLATRLAVNNGIIFIAAPGSHLKGFKRIFTFPAKYPETIAAAASTFAGTPWRLTHGGAEVDICAPGDQIVIAAPYRKNGTVYYGYKWSEGSSFAVPFTACGAALWLLHHGGAEQMRERFPGRSLGETFRTLLKATASPFSQYVNGNLYGAGVLNVESLLKAKLPDLEEVAQEDHIASYVSFLKHKMEEPGKKEEYCKKKELMYQALMARIETEGTESEMREHIMDNARKPIQLALRSRAGGGGVKEQVKQFVQEWY